MKKTPFKKKSNQKISVIQRNIWEQCRRICLNRYADENGEHRCYTCNQSNLLGANRQLGHMWAKASLGAHLKYDLRVLRIQCWRCNINMGGRGADFYARMLKENGQEYMDSLEKEKQIIVKAYDYYLKILEEYKLIEK